MPHKDKEKQREYMRKWQIKNRQHLRSYLKTWRAGRKLKTNCTACNKSISENEYKKNYCICNDCKLKENEISKLLEATEEQATQ